MPQFAVTTGTQTTTVTTTDKLQPIIQGDADMEETINDLVSGIRQTHSFGKNCSGDTGGATGYVHIVRSANQRLLAYSNLVANPRSITITAVGTVKGGAHSFNIKGKF
jgi:hypothetical protein